jgi:hypothetical protein
MNDVIYKQAAIEVIDAVFPVDPSMSEYTRGIACGAALAKTYVEQLPSVEAEPVRHGKWLTDNDAFKRMYLVCSLCKRATQTPWYVGGFLYDYCPNCGARMDGEQNG